MKNKLTYILCVSCIVVLTGCGLLKQNSKLKYRVPTPTKAQADSILGLENAVVFVDEEVEGPAIYGFSAHRDSLKVRVVKKGIRKGEWVKLEDYLCADNLGALPFVSYGDSASLRTFGAKRCFTFSYVRGDGKHFSKSIAVYCPADLSFNELVFSGDKRRDGRIYGNDNRNFNPNPGNPEFVWAINEMEKDKSCCYLSEAQIKSDQAVKWWMSRNKDPRSPQISFGLLPEDCSLVEVFKSSVKEKGESFDAALFDTQEYTVIVAYNRKSSQYILAWAEPVCLDSKSDPLLNSIFFTFGNILSMMYYKGNKAYKYKLSLSSGSISRFK